MTDNAAAPTWAPAGPEMCGQCGYGEVSLTWFNVDGTNALCEFTCQRCGYIVSRYGYDPREEDH